MPELRKLGNSDLNLSAIGVGAWAIGGGGWAFAWGAQDDNESVEAIQAMIAKGVNWIDTAAVYGFGHSEEIVGRAVKGLSEKPYLFTKCARRWNDKGEILKVIKRESVMEECENSLKRLGVDTIDLYQMHWPEPDEDVEEGWGAMAELQKQGKVRWIGVSNFSVAQLKRAQAIAPVTSLQPPYSMITADVGHEILPYCLAQNIGTIVYSPMKAGLLTGAMTKERAENLPADDWRRRNPSFQEPDLSRNLALVELLRELGAAHGRSPGEVAVAWALHNPAVTAAIVGVRSAKQVDGVIGALDFRLTDRDFTLIEQYRLANGI